ncbi:putative oxidoreductase [Gordonia malaquae NBRC 108250]|uniref:Putative oxidoreductase n=1 Tax=Gordonia malaquae NBRC 108250 TaxID=1223542 RepID=M3VEP2_GORML|nr:putative oxidoreductase [Gordonia malaquae NBRC 108250]
MQMFTSSVRPIPVDQVEAFDHDVDVLVVGFGCAGASAALEADAAGAQVVILEQRSGGGGSSALSGGEMYLGGGTSVQRACGFDDSASAMEAFLLAALGPDCDPEKVRLYCENSVAHFDWLVDQGVPFKDSLWPTPTWVPPTDDGLMWMGEKAFPFADLAAPAPRGHRVTADGFGGKVLMDVLCRRVSESTVDVHVDTVALRLVVDGDQVVGVVARHFDTTVTYRVRGGWSSRQVGSPTTRRCSPNTRLRSSACRSTATGATTVGASRSLRPQAGQSVTCLRAKSASR